MQKRLMMPLIISLAALQMNGCTENKVVVDTFCLHAQNIDHFDYDEHLNDQHSRMLEKQDQYGIEHCGWH